MAKPDQPHVGIQTHVFRCAKGHTFQVHGHTAQKQHGNAVRRQRTALKGGCKARVLKAGATYRATARNRNPVLGHICGAAITEEVLDHETPAMLASHERETQPELVTEEDVPTSGTPASGSPSSGTPTSGTSTSGDPS